MRLPTSLALLLILAGCEAAAPEPDRNMTAAEVAAELEGMKIQPGQWEATNEIISASAPGMPPDILKGMIGQKTSVSNCITPEQAAKPSANFLTAQQTNNCTYQNWSMDGGRMTGTMTCAGGQMPGTVVIAMSGNYGESAYDLDMNMNTKGLPGGMTMTIEAKTTGRRTGECTRT